MRKIAICLGTLLAASCSYYVPVNDVTLAAGQSTTIIVETHHYFAGTWIVSPAPPLISSDPSIVTVVQSPNSTSVTLQALQTGTAYLSPIDANYHIVTVHVFAYACAPVSVRPVVTNVPAVVGVPVELKVVTEGIQPIGTSWYEDTPTGWSFVPSPYSNSHVFTPKTSGTFRFEVVYRDRCAEASAIITVVASTRVRAVRH